MCSLGCFIYHTNDECFGDIHTINSWRKSLLFSGFNKRLSIVAVDRKAEEVR